MAAYVGLSQHIDFGRLQSPGDRFELRDMIGEGEYACVVWGLTLNWILIDSVVICISSSS